MAVGVKLLHIEKIQPGMILARDIPVPRNRYVPLIRRDTLLTDRMIGEMHAQGVLHAYIKETGDMTEEEKRRDPIVAGPQLPGVKKPPIISPELRESAISSLKDLFHFATISEDVHDASKLVGKVDEVVDQLVDSLLKDPNALININDLKSYDDYTYHHSLSVAVLSIAIGQHLGFARAEMNKLGECAMMHDIGKTALPVGLINKNDKLTDEEFELIKTHPAEGYRYLHKTHLGDDYIRQAVLYHHEKMDGTGYPYGARGDEIPVWSRIISVSDVYDALTSNRPYRDPMQPYEAVEYIMGGTGKAFDFDIVYAFVQKLELYPVGSSIELSNGKTAIVLANENQLRPMVRLLDTGEILDLNRDKKSLNIVVRRIVPDPELLSTV